MSIFSKKLAVPRKSSEKEWQMIENATQLLFKNCKTKISFFCPHKCTVRLKEISYVPPALRALVISLSKSMPIDLPRDT